MVIKCQPLIPPFRYHMVEDGVYRGAYPAHRNQRFLKRLNLKTVLSLTPEEPHPNLAAFWSEEGIRCVHVHVDKYKENITVTQPKICQALSVIINKENHPMYVHCYDGMNVTGMVILFLRKLQMWSLPLAISEFIRFQKDSVISSEESEFADTIVHSELEIPSCLPTFLDGIPLGNSKHPTFPKLKFLGKMKRSAGVKTNRQDGVGVLGEDGNSEQDAKVKGSGVNQSKTAKLDLGEPPVSSGGGVATGKGGRQNHGTGKSGKGHLRGEEDRMHSSLMLRALCLEGFGERHPRRKRGTFQLRR
eukprot:Nk52_evm2s153 gene=Nk52_evmTU2s153